MLEELLYLDEVPVASVRPAAGGGFDIHPIYADHLGTPRVVTDPSGRVVWEWKLDTFGAQPPNENPSGLGMFTFNLRYPGQYYDVATGLHYNYFRDYDPAIGRYVESDPVGLQGGLNTYAYALDRPISDSDATGLAVWLCFRALSGVPIGNHAYFFDDKTSQCCGNPGWGRDVRHPRAKYKEGGPGKDVCTLISSSDSDSEKLPGCCNQRSNPWTYFPTLNDCQNTADECIRSMGMAPPASPNDNRFRSCNSCWTK